MKVNKNSPRRPLRPLSAIIDFPTPAGRRWGKHFRDGKKSSECWERENNPKKLCVFVPVWSVAIATLETVPLQRALDDDDDARRRARFRWVGANSHKEKHTSILWVLTRTSLGQSCRMVEGGGKFQYRPTRETASRNRHGVLTVPSTCRVVYYWHDDRGTWARVGKQSKRIAMATP